MKNIDRAQIIFYFIATTEGHITSESLASLTNVSIRTIKNDMQVVEEIANRSGSKLCSSPGKGYTLEVLDESKFSATLYQLRIRNAYSLNFKDTDLSNEYFMVMQYMIAQDSYFKLEEIVDKFFLPKNLISEVFTYFKEFIAAYNLKVETKPNHGNIIIGEEFDKRITMLMLFDINFHNIEVMRNVPSFYQYFEDNIEEINETRYILLSSLRKHSYRIHDDYSQCLARYMVLQKKRNKQGLYLNLSNHTLQQSRKFTIQQKIAREIFESFTKYYHVSYTQEDIDGLVILMLLWSDSPSKNMTKELFFPIYDTVKDNATYYLEYLQKQYGISPTQKDYFLAFVIDRYTILYLHNLFNKNTYDIRAGTHINKTVENSLGSLLATALIDFEKNNYSNLYSQYLTKKLIQDFSLFVLRSPMPYPLRILISSGKGIEGALNLKSKIHYFISDTLIDSIRCIELYEGRDIPYEAYDFFILDNLGAIFYNYDWPMIVVNGENPSETMNLILSKIMWVENKKRKATLASQYKITYKKYPLHHKKTISYQRELEMDHLIVYSNHKIEYNLSNKTPVSLYNLNILLGSLVK